jgi:FMN-dependent NADH-azoreductase
MSTLLKLDSSPMGPHSISRKLTSKFADSWLKLHPEGNVVARDLTLMGLPAVDGFWVGAAFTPAAARTPEQNQALAISDALVADLQHANEYVLGVPMHNFGVPSTLKLWIDQVVRAGETFAYTTQGPSGLLTDKKATLLIASGGSYEHGSAMASLNFVAPYLKAVFGFIGITDVNIIAAEGTAQLMSGKVDPEAFLAPTLDKVHAQASL